MVGGWAVGRGNEADYCVTLANCSNLQTVREGETDQDALDTADLGREVEEGGGGIRQR